MLWRQVKALVETSRGDHMQAEQLAREAVTIGEQTDAVNVQGDVLYDLAEVLRSVGRTEEAAAALKQALDRYERKKNLFMADRIRAKLAELRPAAAPAEGRSFASGHARSVTDRRRRHGSPAPQASSSPLAVCAKDARIAVVVPGRKERPCGRLS
jgi:thioredoxin-like negative regulator of GroEL